MKLNPEPFEKIASGKKTIELRLYDEKRKLVKANDEIIFSHTQCLYRSISVIVDSVMVAASFESLFKHISLINFGYEENEISSANYLDMNRYYSEDKQAQYGVVGIRFSINERRVLSEIQIPHIEAKNYIEHLIEVSNINFEGLNEWYQWHCESRWRIPDHDNLEDIIGSYDSSIRE